MAAPPPAPPPGGTYETRPYSVSGCVNGYNPSLPAYPPTRAQLEAAAKRAVAPPSHGGYGGEIADMMSAQIRFEQGSRLRRHVPPSRPRSRRQHPLRDERRTERRTRRLGRPRPRGDPTKPPPAPPTTSRHLPEPVHDPSKEEREMPLGGAAGPPPGPPDATRRTRTTPSPSATATSDAAAADDPHLVTAGDAVRAAPGGRDAIFLSAKIAPGDVSDPAAAVDRILASACAPPPWICSRRVARRRRERARGDVVEARGAGSRA